MMQHLTSGGQSTGVLASVSVLPMNIQGWFPLKVEWFDLLADQGTHKSPLAPQFKSINSSVFSLLSLLSWKWRPLGQSVYFKDRGGEEVLPIGQVWFTGQPEVTPSLWPPFTVPEQALQGQTPIQPHPPPQACFLFVENLETPKPSSRPKNK